MTSNANTFSTQTLSAKGIFVGKSHYFDVIRTSHQHSVVCEEVLELIAKCCSVKTDNNYFFFDLDDSWLVYSAQAIGLCNAKYLATSERGDIFDLWETASGGVIVDATSVHTNGTKILRLVLELGKELRHDPVIAARQYLLSNRTQERYFFGITNIQEIATQRFESSGTKPIDTDRKISHFSDIVNQRRSCNRFKNVAFSSEQLESVIRDSFLKRASGTRPFAVAGGLGPYHLIIGCQNIKGLESGLYLTGDETFQPLNRFSSLPDEMLLTSMGLKQPWLSEAGAWIFVVVDPEILLRKYGKRAYRFIYMETGGLLQQMHLSCTSYGLGFRILGGFDDQLANTLAEVQEPAFISAIALLGSEHENA